MLHKLHFKTSERSNAIKAFYRFSNLDRQDCEQLVDEVQSRTLLIECDLHWMQSICIHLMDMDGLTLQIEQVKKIEFVDIRGENDASSMLVKIETEDGDAWETIARLLDRTDTFENACSEANVRMTWRQYLLLKGLKAERDYIGYELTTIHPDWTPSVPDYTW